MISEFIKILSPGLIRGLTGWIENSVGDGKITKLEWQQLGATVIRIGLLSTSLYFGADIFTEKGIDLVSAGFAAILVDVVLYKIFKKKK